MKMKAVVYTKYGPPEVLQIRDVPKPNPKKNEVRIKVRATAVTASDAIVRGFKLPRWSFMGLMMALVVGILAAGLSSASTFLSLVGFSISNDIGGKPLALTVNTTRKIMLATSGDTPQVSVFATENPPRIVLDLADTENNAGSDAVRVGAGAVELERDLDLLGDTEHGEVADQHPLPVTLLGSGADEGDRRVLLHVEEVGAAQVVVALLVARVDARGLDRDLDRALGQVVPGLDGANDAGL